MRMISGTQVRMARAGLRLTVADLAASARVAPAVIGDIEDDRHAHPDSIASVRRALETAGAEFLGEGSRPGVRLRGPLEPASQGLRPSELNASNDD
jgi:hypothetical protein